MRLFGFDAETTGLDTAVERVTEIGACLWDTELQKPIVTVGVFLNDDGIRARIADPEVAAMMLRVSGTTPSILEEFGTDPRANFQWVNDFCGRHRVDYIVAHNGTNYDKPLLLAELDRFGLPAPVLRALPWLDTRTDIPFPTEPDSRRLVHLATDHGFLNPFPHRAVFDVLTMLKVLSHYKLDEVIAYSKIPFILCRAIVTFDQKQWAKDLRYSWEKLGTEYHYPKCWIKLVKEDKYEAEVKAGLAKGFQVVRL